MLRILPRLALLLAVLAYVAVVAWGCARSGPGGRCQSDPDCAFRFGSVVCGPNLLCISGCRADASLGENNCQKFGKVCSTEGHRIGECVECKAPEWCASGVCLEEGVCGDAGALLGLGDGPFGLPRAPALSSRTPGPSFASNPDPSILLSTYEAGEKPALTLNYDFTAGELRTLQASLLLPGNFGVDLTPPLTCASDSECPGGSCIGSSCEPTACAADPDCPDFGPGEAALPGFCFTPAGGGPSACRVGCDSTPTPPVGGSCSGVDNCPAGTSCSLLDDQTCGCAPLPEEGRGLGLVGLDFGPNGVIDLLAPVLSYDDHTAFVDLDGDTAITGEPLILHQEATATLAHRLTFFVPPADDPMNPDPLVPQSARTYVIFEAGVLTNPTAGGELEPQIRLLSVDPDSGGFDDELGLPPQSATFIRSLAIESTVFVDGFESADTSAWSIHRP